MILNKVGYGPDFAIFKGQYQGLEEAETILGYSHEACIALEAGH